MTMDMENDNTAVLCPTKAGNGFKIVVNGTWYYAAKRNVWSVLRNGRNCVFRTIDDDERSFGGGTPFPKSGQQQRQNHEPRIEPVDGMD